MLGGVYKWFLFVSLFGATQGSVVTRPNNDKKPKVLSWGPLVRMLRQKLKNHPCTYCKTKLSDQAEPTLV